MREALNSETVLFSRVMKKERKTMVFGRQHCERDIVEIGSFIHSLFIQSLFI